MLINFTTWNFFYYQIPDLNGVRVQKMVKRTKNDTVKREKDSKLLQSTSCEKTEGRT